ncbi:MAG: HAD family hydrolase [Melioribacter sp.]|jgi:HAD superfamily hydrolase (TIGR01549 family)|uniref:HAD family hydrolase n=1 Tax=Melioribacter sp. TaxID=2052167 RepID=UPI003BEAE091
MTMDLKLVVFDLDGTLVSSHKTIYAATIETFNRLGIEHNLTEDEFYSRIGLHFEDIFEEFGINVPDFKEFIELYKSIYFDFIKYSELYEGVKDILTELKRNKIKRALLTTKSQEQAELILKYFGIDSEFDFIMGRRPGFEHKPSPQPLLFICESLNVIPSDTLMVGDTELDVLCAKNANAKSCAVTYGYRTANDLIKLEPDLIVGSLDELRLSLNGK